MPKNENGFVEAVRVVQAFGEVMKNSAEASASLLDQVKELRRLANQMEASYRPGARKARRVYLDDSSTRAFARSESDYTIEFLEVLQPAKDARVLWVPPTPECSGSYQRADGSLIKQYAALVENPVAVGSYFTRFVEMPE